VRSTTLAAINSTVMKFLVLIFFVLSNCELLSQDLVDSRLNFQVICGAGAETSIEIQEFKKIIELNDSGAINKKLISGTRIEKVLAALTLKFYQSKGSRQLTENQSETIRQISKFEDKFSLCFTCTFHQHGTIKQLFYRKRFSLSNSILENYLTQPL
jgi:hypothetical protein